ncbi:dTDP-glucose 4,6-dehydratase [Lentilactobacillus diolivorans]|uniref:dTDP-glucose 4,6-dehydratase n=1 Tax=Lentilactobacillus diolivorans TaxID=179838 RepID=UPI0024686A04|nr:dTDP-glucose 4,6-dehydratase [Lentilactobacillus diolivorans]MDH5106588.1 dTDP-glucose 4,6-dehydratase [Lentilactobacillus diolivorans]
MNLLVTGGAGFIGSNFIHYLMASQSHDSLVNYDLLTYAGNLANLADINDDSRYTFVQGDITDEAHVNAIIKDYRIDAIVNFAAESHVDRSILNPNVFVSSNFVGLSVLLNAARKFNIRLVQISTDEVYGTAKFHQAFDEDGALKPSSPYSATKASADLLALAYFKTYGTDICITRSANNYGRFQFPEKLIPLMVVNGLLGKKLPIYGKGENSRDWLNVIDNCAAIDAVLRSGKSGQIYNIAGHYYRTNLEVVNQIVQELGLSKSQIEFVSDRPANDLQYMIDDSKIRSELGWHSQVSFSQGLRATIKWYVNHAAWWRPLLKQVKNR